ncbi:hypothetical protein NDU88_002389 [Pleurodeles waltl]|uniref:Uncharacterized protein n=1 Tax=Pleurodeles waltl TaxID=8319 RepID=A0AAV7UD06_PLEWA|nr:hypothetical protein NDU88_002389 [Pleurodeles waltl]
MVLPQQPSLYILGILDVLCRRVGSKRLIDTSTGLTGRFLALLGNPRPFGLLPSGPRRLQRFPSAFPLYGPAWRAIGAKVGVKILSSLGGRDVISSVTDFLHAYGFPLQIYQLLVLKVHRD